MKIFTKSLKTLFFLLIISNLAQAQVYEKGKVVIDAYYGFPNLVTGYYKTLINASNAAGGNTGITATSIGPLGARVEYLLSDKVGFGVDFSYANTTLKYTNVYNYQVSIPRWRVVPRINLHLGQSTKLDPYFAFGLGYDSWGVVGKTNDPNYVNYSVKQILPIYVPVVIMAKFGMRYFITDNLGLGFELGLGGPLATGGVTVKF
jgi:hypothetical protein